MPNLSVFNYHIKSDSYVLQQKVCRTLLVVNGKTELLIMVPFFAVTVEKNK